MVRGKRRGEGCGDGFFVTSREDNRMRGDEFLDNGFGDGGLKLSMLIPWWPGAIITVLTW